MKVWRAFGLFVLLIIAAGGAWLWWKAGATRRASVQTLQRFNAALTTGNSADLLNAVVMPAAIQGRTGAEQTEFLTKALRDEISPEGLAVLQRDGAFGPLTNIFPAEAQGWAGQAGVKPEDCVAFKLERNGLRAEVDAHHLAPEALSKEDRAFSVAAGDVEHPARGAEFE